MRPTASSSRADVAESPAPGAVRRIRTITSRPARRPADTAVWAVLAAVVGAVALVPGADAWGCLDESGAPVDWWVIMKQNTSTMYSYADPSSAMARSSHDLSNPNAGALSNTLQQVFDANGAAVAWNDETPPGHKTTTYAHSKGVVGLTWASDAESRGAGLRGAASGSAIAGFYLLHSVPRFPDLSGSAYAGYPDNEEIYGQSMLCVSLDGAALNTLGKPFQLNRPQVYNDTLSGSAFAAQVPDLAAAASGEHSTDPVCQEFDISTVGGQALRVFGKTKQWDNDLWDACVATNLGVPMAVESWIRGGDLGPCCSCSQPVVDVEQVYWNGNGFTETQDHSKWGVAMTSVGPQPSAAVAEYACIGDINRMDSQASRGGGAVCFQDRALWSAMVAAITTRETCS